MSIRRDPVKPTQRPDQWSANPPCGPKPPRVLSLCSKLQMSFTFLSGWKETKKNKILGHEKVYQLHIPMSINSFTDTPPCPLTSVLSVATLGHSDVAVIDTVWSAKLNTFTMCPFFFF